MKKTKGALAARASPEQIMATLQEERRKVRVATFQLAIRSALIRAKMALQALEMARGTRSASAVAQTGVAVLTARRHLTMVVGLLGALPFSGGPRAAPSEAIAETREEEET